MKGMTPKPEAWLAYLQRSVWLTHAPAELVRIRPAEGDGCAIGSVTVTEPALLAAQPPGPPAEVKQFHLVHDGWRIASFRLFRPLACFYVAFGSLVIFEAPSGG
jgi:hypothetical protein